MLLNLKKNIKRKLVSNSLVSIITEKLYSEAGINITFKSLISKRLIKKDKIKIIYDIGCHKGEWTNDIKTILPKSRIYQFDAVDYPKNKYDNVSFHKICLGDKNETRTFYKRSESGDSLFKEKGDLYSDKNKVKIKVNRLDDFLSQEYIEPPDYLKIDAQGAELIILNGGINTIKNTKFIQLEVSYVEYNEGGCLFEDVLPYMRTKNFHPIAFAHIKGNDHRIIQSDILFQKFKS